MVRFSERIGVKPLKTVLQLDSMDGDLRNGLWNVCYDLELNVLSVEYFRPRGDIICGHLWRTFFRLPIDQMPYTGPEVLEFIRRFYFKVASWHENYDFVEVLGGVSRNERFPLACNAVLAREMSGYRFVGRQLTPITDEEQLAAIQSASQRSEPWRRPVYAIFLSLQRLNRFGAG